MSFRFKRHESVGDGFRRIMASELDAVQLLLQAAASGPQQDEAVHDARRRLKKARSLLRLLREPLGKKLCRHHVHTLSDAADRLAPARDARVRLAALEAIARKADPSSTRAVDRLRRTFTRELRDAERHALDSRSVAELHRSLNQTLTELAAAPLDDGGWSLLEKGIARMCRRVRHAYAAAEEQRDTAALHNWRKRSKDMQYQMRLFHGTCPAVMKTLDQRLDRLNELLGDDHDLALLEAALRARKPAFLNSPAAASLLATIAQRRQTLQHRAFELGGRLLPAKPQQFTRQLAKRWHSWHKGR